MKDYLSFDDEELKAFIKQHKGTIHTREFPTRCGTCRFIARFEAAEVIAKHIANDKCSHDHHGYCQTHFISAPCPVATWEKAAGKNENPEKD